MWTILVWLINCLFCRIPQVCASLSLSQQYRGLLWVLWNLTLCNLNMFLASRAIVLSSLGQLPTAYCSIHCQRVSLLAFLVCWCQTLEKLAEKISIGNGINLHLRYGAIFLGIRESLFGCKKHDQTGVPNMTAYTYTGTKYKSTCILLQI